MRGTVHNCNDPIRIYNKTTGNCVLCDSFKELSQQYQVNDKLTRKENCINILNQIEQALSGGYNGDQFPVVTVNFTSTPRGNGVIDRLSYFTIQKIRFDTLDRARKQLVKQWKHLYDYIPQEAEIIIVVDQLDKKTRNFMKVLKDLC